MSQEIFYHGTNVIIKGYSQYELQALKIPNAARGECLPMYVPYMKCILNANSFSRWTGRACEDEKANYSHCKKIQRERVDSTHLKKMKLNNPGKFEQLNVAPALETEYAPTFLNLTRH